MPDSNETVPTSSWQNTALLCCAAMLLLVPLTPPYLLGVQAKALVLDLLGFAALVAIAAWLRRRETLRVSPTSLGLAALVVAAAISLPGAAEPMVALLALPFLLGLLALHLGVLYTVDNLPTARRGALLVLLACGVVAVVGLHGYLRFRTALAAGAITEASRSAYLSTPFFEHSYLAAQAILPAAFAALGLLLAGGGARRLALLLVLVPIVAFLLATLSRSAGIATLCGLAVVGAGLLLHATFRRRGSGAANTVKWTLLSTGAAAAALLVLAYLGLLGASLGQIAGRFTSFAETELATFNFSRLLVWEDSLRMLSDHLPFGVGQGNFGIGFGDYHLGRRSVPHAHNQFLHTLVETGPLGLFGLLLATLHPLALTTRLLARRRMSGELTGAVLGCTAALCVLVVYFLFESPLLFGSAAVLFAALSGLLVRLARLAGAEDPAGWTWTAAAARRAGTVLVVVAVAVSCCALPAVVWNVRARHSVYRAAAALAANDADAARVAATRATEQAPYLPEGWRLLGDAQCALGDLEGALASYQRHDELAPGLPEVLWRRATALIQLGRPAEAIEPLLRARFLVPAESRNAVLLTLANAYYAAARYDETYIICTRLLRANYHGESPLVLRRLAESLLNLGRERPLAAKLLRRYAEVVSPEEAAYADGLASRLDEFYTDPWNE